jgi:hypothetical protein
LPGFSTANAGFFGANDPLVLQSVPAAIQFSGIGDQKGDSGYIAATEREEA